MAQRGFTLIELLITLLIASLLASVAVPAFTNFLARQQLANDVNGIVSVMSFARSQAITQRRDMVVTFSPPEAVTNNRRPESCRNNEVVEEAGGNSQNTASYRYSDWCYWVERSDEAGEVLRVGQVANITAPTNEFSLVFKSLGDADIDDCDGSQCEITVSPSRSAAVDDITLIVRATGSIRRDGL